MPKIPEAREGEIFDLNGKHNAIKQFEMRAGVDARFNSVTKLSVLVAEAARNLGLKVNSETFRKRPSDTRRHTADEIKALISVVAFDPEAREWTEGTAQQFYDYLCRCADVTGKALLPAPGPESSPEDHLVSIWIEVPRQESDGPIPIGGSASLLVEIRFNVSPQFRLGPRGIGLASCHLRLKGTAMQFTERMDPVRSESYRLRNTAFAKLSGASRTEPFWTITSDDGVLNGAIVERFATMIGIDLQARVDATLSAWMADIQPAEIEPGDESLRFADGERLDPSNRDVILARLRTMTLPAPEEGLIPLAYHHLDFKAVDSPAERDEAE